MPRPSIVVETSLNSVQDEHFDRWFGALQKALEGASELGAIGGWRISAEVDHEFAHREETVLTSYAERALAGGGEFSFDRLSSRTRIVDLPKSLERSEQEEELVLWLSPGVLILTSTLVRMVRALESFSGGVTARSIPFDQAAGSGPASGEMGAGRCILYMRSVPKAAAESSPALVRDPDAPTRPDLTDGFPLRLCPSAVAFSDTSVDSPSRQAGEPALQEPDGPGSLLEETLLEPGMLDARNDVVKSLTASSVPLLSIVMRTQVRRPEALRDVLLCLAGQSDGRFELVLVVHDGDLEEARHILLDQPRWLQVRTRVLSASGGTRSRPLNVGIEGAQGSHIAFLDDDDLVLANWVSTFLEAAVWHPRKLLRARVGVQRVRAEQWEDGVFGHSVESGIDTPYPEAYDLGDHLRVNLTPFMAFAFPRGFLTVFGGADESLEVCEDWDLALRAASVIGVTDIPTLTAIYRRWSSGDDSYSRHASAIWERDMVRVRAKLDGRPVVVGAGAASKLARETELDGIRSELAALRSSSSWRITAPLRAVAQWANRFRQ